MGNLVTREGKAKGGSPLWAVQLSEGLVWKTIMQYTFRQVEHINLQECKARRSLLKRVGHSKRLVMCQDSRVNLGALGKGRQGKRHRPVLKAISTLPGPQVPQECLHTSALELVFRIEALRSTHVGTGLRL